MVAQFELKGPGRLLSSEPPKKVLDAAKGYKSLSGSAPDNHSNETLQTVQK